MSKLLFVTTVYRTGEKVYPVLPFLAADHSVDVLNLYQMSKHTPWNGDHDLRQKFYNTISDNRLRSFHGPAWKVDDNAPDYRRYFDEISDMLKKKYYDLVIVDNNVTIKGGAMSMLYELFHSQGIRVLACPHGNRTIKGYRIHKRINRHYDYSFVFGIKEKRRLSQFSSKTKNRLLCGGIPSNDNLKNLSIGNKYILIIPNIVDPEQIYGQVKSFRAFTKSVFDDLGIIKLSDKKHCPIVIKEKNKLYHNSSVLRKSLKVYPVKFILDAEDDNQLIADARYVISAPSTLAFKSIQMGIPTIILKNHGMTGNFDDFPGFIESRKHLFRSLRRQENEGKNERFIASTLEGGLKFNSTQIYLKHIKTLMEGSK